MKNTTRQVQWANCSAENISDSISGLDTATFKYSVVTCCILLDEVGYTKGSNFNTSHCRWNSEACNRICTKFGLC